MGKLDGKVVFLTGGGGAIARGMVVALAKEGAAIAIAELDATRGQEAAAAVVELGGRATAIGCDVSDRSQVDAAVAETVSALGGVHVLINNATGVTIEATNLPLVDHSEAIFDRILGVDVKGTVNCMQACFPHFQAQQRGSIINFSSGAGTERMAGFAAYAAAKEGVRALTGVAAREWGEHGVNVNVVCPSAMTPGIEHFLANHPDPDYAEQLFKDRPIKRLGDTERDIGAVVAFLASDEASYLTGHTFWVDGGSTIHS